MKLLTSQTWPFFPLITTFIALQATHAFNFKHISSTHFPSLFSNEFLRWTIHKIEAVHPHKGDVITKGSHLILVALLCFIAGSISSAGGLGGGGLFIPILQLVAALDLKTATSFTAFMVTGGSVANVMFYFFKSSPMHRNKPLIDYDIALLSQPCMLLGVSVGVICNVVFPEWLITFLFAVFLVCSTIKTCRTGIAYWKIESEGVSMRERSKAEAEDGEMVLRDPLLEEKRDGGVEIPVKKMGVLVLIWTAFFVVHLLQGSRDGQSIIELEPCGTGYWLISSLPLPLALAFTLWTLQLRETPQHQSEHHLDMGCLGIISFPLVALSSGVMGGLFGIGGGMLINPILLQIGISPQITAATCSLMILFSSSMSSVQYLILGMKHAKYALIFSMVAFFSSLVGLAIVQRAISKHGRASIIVFSVGLVMALSTILVTSFGAIDLWREYKNGEYMGFNFPC